MKGSIETILVALNQADVRYLIVGGVGVVLHGYLRTTADLDLVIQLDRENVLKTLRALDSVGYRPKLPVRHEQFADPQTRKSWIEDKGMLVFPLYSDRDPLLGIDLFVREPFEFDAVYSRALQVPLDRTTAVVVALDDLIAMKEAAARPRDIEDVEALKALREANEVDDE